MPAHEPGGRPKLGNATEVAKFLYDDPGPGAQVRVRRLCRAGELRYITSGKKGTYWIEWASVDAYLERVLSATGSSPASPAAGA
jgi:hypothetical protein